MTSDSLGAPSRKRRIYIAGPLRGEETYNVRNAIKAADTLIGNGYAVYCPHLNVLHDFLYPRSAQEWIKHDIEWLTACDAVLRLRGESEGAEIEVCAATVAFIPVYMFIDDLLHGLTPWVPVPNDPVRSDGLVIANLVRIAWEGLLYHKRHGSPRNADVAYVRAVQRQRNLPSDGEKPPSATADVVTGDTQEVASDDPV